MADNKDNDDHILWEHVTQSVKPLPGKKSVQLQREKKVKLKQQPKTASHDFIPVHTKKKTTHTTKRPNQGIDRRTMDKLRKGKIAIEARIDLHGMREAEAHAAFNRFIKAAKQSGQRCLLVITGKGKTGESQGKLRRALPLWIEASFVNDVLAYSPAAPKDGGSGAWYVFLRRDRT